MALVRCRTSFIRGTETGEEMVGAGEVFDDSHEIVRKTPAEYWEPLQVRGAVEEATAVPGKKRTTRAKPDDES